MLGKWIRGWCLVFLGVWKEWSGMEMAEEEKAVSVYVRFEQVFLWATSKRSYQRYTVKIQSTQMGIMFSWTSVDVKKISCFHLFILFLFLVIFIYIYFIEGEIKDRLQSYSQCAACSHELFSELWIDAGGKRAAAGRKRLDVGVQPLYSMFEVINYKESRS